MAIEPKSPTGGEHEKVRTLGKYQIVKRLGAGGMGAVFLATDTELKRAVALKVLPKDRAENPTLVRRFKAEAQAVAQLRHDNIVSIYDTGELQGFPYLALEYVDGQDLLSLIEKRGPIPAKRSLKIIRQVTDALQHAYERNIIHRDIKPSNLLVQVNGTTKITDFGLARSVDETLDTSITRAGTTVGTVDYISPEQACNSKSADIRSDLYSLGCTWYHMVTGQPPYPDGNMQEKIRGHINSPPPNPRRINPNVPEAYVAVMHQMMAKRPQDRYQTPADLLRDLDQVAGAVSSVNAELFDEPSSGGSFSDDDEDEAPTKRDDGGGKKKPRKSPKPSAGEAAATGEEVSKINEQWRGRGGAVRKPTATRGLGSAPADLEGGDAVDEDVGTSRKSKKLPPRERKDPGGFSIDLDFVRIGLIGLVVAGAVGLFWYAFSRGGSWTSTSDGGGGVETAVQNPVVEVVTPPAPQGNGLQAPQVSQIVQPNVVVTTPTTSGGPPNPAVSLAAVPVNVDRSGVEFPGLDDIEDLNSTAGKELLPDWVIALRQAGPPSVTALQVKTETRTGAEPSLDAAILRTSGRERVIELEGTGPFTLRPIAVTGCDRLLIRAAENSDPLVLLQGVPNTVEGQAHLQLSGGVLQIEGVHFIAPVSITQQPMTLFGVQGGTIALTDCSITVPNESQAAVVARAADAVQHPFPSRVLLENCLIRGSRATAASLHGDGPELVLGGSLLANESGPLVQATQIAAASPAANATTTNVAPEAATPPDNSVTDESPNAAPRPLAIRIAGSMLWSNDRLFELQQAKSDAIRQASIHVHRSLLAAAGGAESTLLSLGDWPLRATGVSGQPRVAGLHWKQDQSSLAGWSTLLRCGSEVVTSAENWAPFMGDPLPTGEFDLASAVARTVNLEHLSFADVRSLPATSPLPGASALGVTAALPEPPRGLIDKLLLLNGRPRLPEGFQTLAPSADVIQHDLKASRQSLGEFLNSSAVPNGSHVRITGVGLVAVPPFELHDKSLRLEFVTAAEGAPLTIRPEVKSGASPEAWLTIDGGRLDLVGAKIQASPSKSRDSASRLILARNCDLTVRNCLLEGAPQAEAGGPGLVDWVQSEPGTSRQYAYIADCQMSGSQPLVSAQIDGRLLVLSNNLLGSQGDGLSLRTSAGAADVPSAREGWVVLDHNTWLFGRFALQFAGLTSGRQSPAARVVATANVFLPAPGSPATCLLRHPESMTAQNLFDWWGRSNGYAPNLTRYRSTTDALDSDAKQDFLADWSRFWGSEHVESPHFGLNGVMLSTVLTTLNGISPPLVQLNPNCSGASGAPDGSSIGIRADLVGPQLGGGSTAQTLPTGPRVGPAKGGALPGNQPGF